MPQPEHAPTLVIGIDGLGPLTARRMDQAGRLPSLARLLGLGQRYRLSPAVPEDPAVLWADLATGYHATGHGVLSTLKPTPTGLERVTTDDWPAKPIWVETAAAGVPTTVINWPATTPGRDRTPAMLTTVSDASIDSDPARPTEQPMGEDRLSAGDIEPGMLAQLLGKQADELKRWADHDPRRMGLSAALARAGTIQNAAVSAASAMSRSGGLLMVRYDLPTVLAMLAMPRPGPFDRLEQDTPDNVRQAVLDGGAELIDAMIAAVVRLMPEPCAVMVVGLLDYVMPPKDQPAPEVVIHHINGLKIMGRQRRLHECQRPSAFGVWIDPGFTLSQGQPAIDEGLRRLNGHIRARYRLPPRPRPNRHLAHELVGLDTATQQHDDRLALGITWPGADQAAVWDAVIHRRALNLARSASANRRWHFAVHAWDLVLTRENKFDYHGMRMQALLNSGRYQAFDVELVHWLNRVPDNPHLRALAEARERVPEPPAPDLPEIDTPTPYNHLDSQPPPEHAERGVWTQISAAAMSRLEQACQEEIRRCRHAYSAFEQVWSRLGPAHLQGPAQPEHQSSNQANAISREARSHIAINSFQDRHTAAAERQSRAIDMLNRVAARRELQPYTEPWLLTLHASAYAEGQPIPFAGRYREHALENRIRYPRIDGRLLDFNHLPLPEHDLPRLTRSMLDTTRHALEGASQDLLIIGPLSFLTLLKIHPFSDGNGRTSRAYLTHILMHHGMPLIQHMDLPGWFERWREPYMGHAFLLPACLASMLNDPPASLTITTRFLIRLIRHAVEQATLRAERLIADEPA